MKIYFKGEEYDLNKNIENEFLTSTEKQLILNTIFKYKINLLKCKNNIYEYVGQGVKFYILSLDRSVGIILKVINDNVYTRFVGEHVEYISFENKEVWKLRNDLKEQIMLELNISS